ncbi:hypothetical protein SH139x_000871 [Planctomycetaceae bacterium SH139]
MKRNCCKIVGLVLSIVLLDTCLPASRLVAQEPGWHPRVLKLGDDRQRTNSLPVVQRPYRPLHIFGNSVRRLHYRGTLLPTAGDLTATTRYFWQR